MYTDILPILRDLRARYGNEAVLDQGRLAGMLADVLTNGREGERHLLLRVLSEGLPQRMLAGETAEVFADRGAVTRYDASHSLLGEDRFRTVGSAAGRRLLLVISTERSGAMRIISARGADRKERLEYESENDGGGMGGI